MIISIANDHRGVEAKKRVAKILRELGHEVQDDGASTDEASDYPDFAAIVARKVATRLVDRGVLICGTGVGMSIAANKISGARATTCDNVEVARLSREHNDVNVLCLAAEFVESDRLEPVLQTWLESEFEGGRHARRVAKIMQLENQSTQVVNSSDQ